MYVEVSQTVCLMRLEDHVRKLLLVVLMANLCLMDDMSKVTSSSEHVEGHWNIN